MSRALNVDRAVLASSDFPLIILPGDALDLHLTFPGLPLQLAIIASAALFLSIAAVAGIVAARRRAWRGRPATIASRAMLMSVGCGIVDSGVVVLTEPRGILDQEWTDWLILPWLAIVAGGCLALSGRGRGWSSGDP